MCLLLCDGPKPLWLKGCVIKQFSGDPHILGGLDDPRALLITVDGGARGVRGDQGRRTAGAGAILWSPADASGARTRLAEVTVALPDVAYAQEVWTISRKWHHGLGS